MIYLEIHVRIDDGFRAFRFLASDVVRYATAIHLPPFPQDFPVGSLWESRDIEDRVYDMDREELVFTLETFGAGPGHIKPFTPEQVKPIVQYLKENGWNEVVWPPPRNE